MYMYIPSVAVDTKVCELVNLNLASCTLTQLCTNYLRLENYQDKCLLVAVRIDC